MILQYNSYIKVNTKPENKNIKPKILKIQGLLSSFAGEEAGDQWETISAALFQVQSGFSLRTVRCFFVFFLGAVIFSVFVNNNNLLFLAAGRSDQGKPHQLFPVCSGLVSSNSKRNLHDINIQAQRLNWLFSKLGGEGAGMMDVLYCVLNDSPEALNMMQEEHIRVIISLLEKFGRDPKVGLGKFRIVSIKC